MKLKKLFILKKNYLVAPTSAIQEKILEIQNYELYADMTVEEVEGALEQITVTTGLSQGRLNNDVTSFLLAGDNELSNGISIPFNILSTVFKGLRKGETMCYAMPSNSGKSRFTLNLASYISFIHKQKVLIISSKTLYNPGYESFSKYAEKRMKDDGYNVTGYNVSDDITQNEYEHILNIINEYDKVIIALNNVGNLKYNNSVKVVNEISKRIKENLLVIGLSSPYDILAYDNINNYICVYCDQLESHNSIIKYLELKLVPKGIAPVNLNE